MSIAERKLICIVAHLVELLIMALFNFNIGLPLTNLSGTYHRDSHTIHITHTHNQITTL